MLKFFFQKFQFFGVMNFKNCIHISCKIQILTILRHKITQIFTKNYYLLSKFSKLHNFETHFCKLLRPHAPPFQKIKWNPWNLFTTLQKSCFLGPPSLKFHYRTDIRLHIMVYLIQEMYILLEPVCCKKQQKKVPGQLLVCRIGDLSGPEWFKTDKRNVTHNFWTNCGDSDCSGAGSEPCQGSKRFEAGTVHYCSFPSVRNTKLPKVKYSVISCSILLA